jgi:hypothetical protein
MRLINTETLEMKEFLGDPFCYDFPEYAILSHTWGSDEVSLKDMSNLDTARAKAGFSKIARCCSIAKSEGLAWAWVDTCCIDKTSSAELSEAINSMFKWYQASTVCYAYLKDVSSEDHLRSRLRSDASWYSLPRWFTRGWTLQELIAPFNVVFYSDSWLKLATKESICDQIARATKIPAGILRHTIPLPSISVGSRMVWARQRETTRPEDVAYCLLGIFDLNMPLLYGEGNKAFMRLQAEILKTTGDHSIFLGGSFREFVNPDGLSADDMRTLVTETRLPAGRSLLSPSPGSFYKGDMMGWPGHNSGQWDQPQLTRGAVQLSLPLRSIRWEELLPRAGTSPAAEDDTDMKNMLTTIKKQHDSLFVGALQFYDARRERVLVFYFVPATTTRESHTSVIQLQPLSLFYWADIPDVQTWTTTKCEFAVEDPRPQMGFPLSASFGFDPILRASVTRSCGWHLENENVANKLNYAAAHYTPHMENARRNVAFFAHGYLHPRLFCCFLVLQSESESFAEKKNRFRDLVKHYYDDSESTCWIPVGDRAGPVHEMSQVVPVDGGNAEMVITLFRRVSRIWAEYYPVFRFRNFTDGMA